MRNIIRSKVLPDNVHFWRGKRWAHLSKKESRKGDALRIIHGLERSIRQGAEAVNSGGERMQQRLTRHAEEIMILSSEMADEKIAAEVRQSLPIESWNEAYVNCLRHYWRKMPRELRMEIVRLSASKK